MSVVEVTQALGSFGISLRLETPKAFLDAIKPFGHVAIMPGRVDVLSLGDNLLQAARYVGVFRSMYNQPDSFLMNGVGMAFWLGDEDSKGDVIESGTSATFSSFANAVRGFLPAHGAVHEGTLYGIPGASATTGITTTQQYATPRDAITYVTTTYATSTMPVEWRVNNNATLDAGPVANLYPSTSAPSALMVRTGNDIDGKDYAITGVPASLSLDTNMEDYTTRVILLGQGTSDAIMVGTADGPATPYKDLYGNPVRLTRVVSESITDATLVAARAQSNLVAYQAPSIAVQLSTDLYDVTGVFKTGDSIYVHDVDAGFIDAANEIYWQGVPINPMKLRVIELDWSIPAYWTVAYRDPNGIWYDLSDYYAPESGSDSVVVGSFLQSTGGGYQEPVGSRPNGDSSVPGTPVFGVPTTSAYQSDTSKAGDTKAQINLNWSLPLNVDGSTIVDGNVYEIRQRPTFLAGSTWTSYFTQWGTNQTIIQELTPGVTYDHQIRALDLAIPPNVSAWSTTLSVVAAADSTAPSTPAAPAVAASTLAIQVTSTLGVAGGGTYNLETDLDHLEIHGSTTSSFVPSASTKVGDLTANIGLMIAGIPAVQTYQVDRTATTWIKAIAVDRTGNKSNASTAVSATSILVNDAHISDLTVTKVTAGTISATWLIGGTIQTSSSGARVVLNSAGIQTFDSSGNQTVGISASNGNATITGRFRTGFPGASTAYLDLINSSDRTTIFFIDPAGVNSAFMNSPIDTNGAPTIGINTAQFSYLSQTSRHRLFLNNVNGIFLQTIRVSDQTTLGGALALGSAASNMSHFVVGGAQTGGQVSMDSAQVQARYNTSGSVAGGMWQLYAGAAKFQAYDSSANLKSELAMFSDTSWWMSGAISANNPIGGAAMVFAGTTTGTSPISITYGSTMASAPWPVATLSSGGTPVAFAVSSSSSTGCSFNWADTGTRRVNYWIIQIV